MAREHTPPRWLTFWRSKTYDVLPALSVRGRELRRSLRLVTIGWVFGSMWMVSIGGATMSNFASLAGFTDIDWGILQAVGFAAVLAQLPASYLVEATGLRKLTFLQTATVHRLLWIPVGFLPLLMYLFPAVFPPRAAVWGAFIIIFCSSVLGNLGAPAWITWMSDLIPPRIRGRYFARRNAYCVTVQIVLTLGLGFVLDLSIRQGAALTASAQPWLVLTLAGIFALAGIAGTIDISLFRRIREVLPPQQPQHPSMRQILTEPLRNRRFLHYVAAFSVLTFGTAISTPFFLPLCQNVLHLNSTSTNLVLMVFGPVGAVVSSKFWGRLIDRWGRRPVMIVCMAGTVFAVWGWLLVPDNQPMAIDAPVWGFLGRFLPVPASPPAFLTIAVAAVVVFIGGVLWTGLEIARFNTLLGFSTEEGRSAYVAAGSIITSVAGIVGGLVGGVLAELTGSFRWSVGPFLFVNYHLVFLASGAIRLFSITALVGMADPGAKPARLMMRAMVLNAYENLTSLLFWPARFAGAGRKATYPATPKPREGVGKRG